MSANADVAADQPRDVVYGSGEEMNVNAGASSALSGLLLPATPRWVLPFKA
jgi:hypothetical protein